MTTLRSRATLVLLAGLTTVLIAVLLLFVGSVDIITFQPRSVIEFSGVTNSAGFVPESGGASAMLMIIRIMLGAGLIGLVVGCFVSRRFRRVFIPLALLAVVGLLLVEYLGLEGVPPPPEETPAVEQEEIERMEEGTLTPLPSPEYETTSTQYIVLAIALSSLFVIVSAVLLTRWLKRRPAPDPETFDDLFGSLSDAAHRIRAGEDPYEVVLFCYQEMIRILGSKGRIDATYLTPREFEKSLRVAGLSDSHIRQLTEIFEVVRYGSRVDQTFSDRALKCLDAIQEAYTPK